MSRTPARPVHALGRSVALLAVLGSATLVTAAGTEAAPVGPSAGSRSAASGSAVLGSAVLGPAASDRAGSRFAGSGSGSGLRSVRTADNDDNADVDRKIKDKRITESSGLAASLLHPGVLWTHNDSGNPPRIYAIGTDGSTRATLTLKSEPNVDWEAITSLRGKDGAALIAVGDIGDNNAQHSDVRIALVREPDQLQTDSVTPVRVLRLRYPDGPRDAEALLADPRSGQLYLVSKALFGSELYAVPKSLWPDEGLGSGRVSSVTKLTKVATMSPGLVTDGVFLPDGRMLLRDYSRMSVIARPDAVRNGRLGTLATVSLPEQEQGESITVTDGGRQALIGSEGKREPVLRIAVPGAGGASGKARATLPPDPPAASPRDKAGAVETTKSVDDPEFSGVGNLRVWTLVVGGAIVLIGFTVAALAVLSRRRR
jgi:hypothetical protein